MIRKQVSVLYTLAKGKWQSLYLVHTLFQVVEQKQTPTAKLQNTLHVKKLRQRDTKLYISLLRTFQSVCAEGINKLSAVVDVTLASYLE